MVSMGLGLWPADPSCGVDWTVYESNNLKSISISSIRRLGNARERMLKYLDQIRSWDKMGGDVLGGDLMIG